MSSSILCARGTVLSYGSKSKGIYDIAGLTTKKGDYPLLIDSVTFGKKDIMLMMSCLNNVKVIYSFGQDFGNVAILGKILLGPIAGGGKSEHMRGLLNWFETNRSSKKKKPVSVSILGQERAEKFYLQSLQLGDPVTEFHIQPFVISGILLE